MARNEETSSAHNQQTLAMKKIVLGPTKTNSDSATMRQLTAMLHNQILSDPHPAPHHEWAYACLLLRERNKGRSQVGCQDFLCTQKFTKVVMRSTLARVKW